MRIKSILVGLFCALLLALPAAAQTTMPAPGYKDPGTAMLVGFLAPGAGQIYTGETKRGLTILGAGVGSLILGSMLATGQASDCYDYDTLAGCDAGGVATSLMLGSLGYLAAWGYGIYDAGDSAARMNARQGLTVAGMRVEPIAAPSAEGTRVGLTLRF